jgi:hypothetical protein
MVLKEKLQPMDKNKKLKQHGGKQRIEMNGYPMR